MSTTEVAVTSDNRGGAIIWEPKGGTILMSYKGGGTCNPHSLGFLGKDYLLGVEKGKPLITVWRVNSQEKETSIRLLCPGRITAMSPSPDSFYIAVGIEDKLHIYQVASGLLLAVASNHFQPITVLTWSKDSCFIASGGEDGIVSLWNLSYLVLQNSNSVGVTSSNQTFAGQADAKYIWSDHALAISDICITPGGVRARLISVSADRFCRIYDLSTGDQLLSVGFETRLASVTVDPTETCVFVGTSDGTVNIFSLREPPRTRDYQVGDKDRNLSILAGHSKAITSLSVSIDGSLLLSASNDETVKLWHIRSKQCLRTLYLKGPVTNTFFTLAPKSMNLPTFEPSVILKPFEKSSEISNRGDKCTIDVLVKNDLEPSEIFRVKRSMNNATTEDNSLLYKELNLLKSVNSQLYQYAISKVLKTERRK